MPSVSYPTSLEMHTSAPFPSCHTSINSSLTTRSTTAKPMQSNLQASFLGILTDPLVRSIYQVLKVLSVLNKHYLGGGRMTTMLGMKTTMMSILITSCAVQALGLLISQEYRTSKYVPRSLCLLSSRSMFQSASPPCQTSARDLIILKREERSNTCFYMCVSARVYMEVVLFNYLVSTTVFSLSIDIGKNSLDRLSVEPLLCGSGARKPGKWSSQTIAASANISQAETQGSFLIFIDELGA